jgi:hypothetical protein
MEQNSELVRTAAAEGKAMAGHTGLDQNRGQPISPADPLSWHFLLYFLYFEITTL